MLTGIWGRRRSLMLKKMGKMDLTQKQQKDSEEGLWGRWFLRVSYPLCSHLAICHLHQHDQLFQVRLIFKIMSMTLTFRLVTVRWVRTRVNICLTSTTVRTQNRIQDPPQDTGSRVSPRLPLRGCSHLHPSGLRMAHTLARSFQAGVLLLLQESPGFAFQKLECVRWCASLGLFYLELIEPFGFVDSRL